MELKVTGPNGGDITDLDTWFQHAPPEGGLAQWRDGYSAKELAAAWTRAGSVAVPSELAAAVAGLADARDAEALALPEHKTRLDGFGRARQHDLLITVRNGEQVTAVVGVEAKACEPFDGVVADRAQHAPPSKRRARCNLMSQALFAHDVMDEHTGEILDDALAVHGYQLWTATVGTIIEAQRAGAAVATVVFHQFRPADLAAAREAGDTRAWDTALAKNGQSLQAFIDAVEEAGATSRETPFVQAGTRIDVRRAETLVGPGGQ